MRSFFVINNVYVNILGIKLKNPSHFLTMHQIFITQVPFQSSELNFRCFSIRVAFNLIFQGNEKHEAVPKGPQTLGRDTMNFWDSRNNGVLHRVLLGHFWITFGVLLEHFLDNFGILLGTFGVLYVFIA